MGRASRDKDARIEGALVAAPCKAMGRRRTGGALQGRARAASAGTCRLLGLDRRVEVKGHASGVARRIGWGHQWRLLHGSPKRVTGSNIWTASGATLTCKTSFLSDTTHCLGLVLRRGNDVVGRQQGLGIVADQECWQGGTLLVVIRITYDLRNVEYDANQAG
jgi:hypothetical protein